MKKTNTFLRNRAKYSLFLIAGEVVSFVITNNAFADDYSLTLTSSGSQDVNISASAGTAISSDSINVSTTCRYGYNFTINTSVNNNNLYLNGNSSNNASGTYFSPVDGTTALNASTNKWGYYYNSSASNTPTSTSIFSPVPTLNNPATVKTPLTTPASSDINDNFNIYYGVSSSDSMPVGTYKMIPDTNNSNNDGTIVYTATIADTCVKYTVRFNATSTYGGIELTGSGTMSDQLIYEGVLTSLNSNLFVAPSGYKFKEWNTLQDGTGVAYKDGVDVMDLAVVGNTFNLYAIWVPVYTINYDGNNADIGITMESNHSNVGEGDIINLYPANYKRDGYGFAGWSMEQLDPDDSNFQTRLASAVNSGKVFGPMATIVAPPYPGSDSAVLYAIWVKSAGDMQNWSGCSNMNIGDVTALEDIRDNDVYAVAKLDDGNCWMIENLRLDNNSINPNWGDDDLSQGFGGVFHGLATPDPPNYFNYSTDWSKPNSLYSIDGSTIYVVSGGIRLPRFANSNTADPVTSLGNTRAARIYSYGNYYNWPAAVANTTNTNNPSTSICPKGWELPIGGIQDINKSYNHLFVSMGYTGDIGHSEESEQFRAYPYNFVYANTFGNALGKIGKYFTRTQFNSWNIYALYLTDGEVRATIAQTDNVYDGSSVRCVVGS